MGVLMSAKIYVCNLWKELTIGKHIHFHGGEFTTDDVALQHLIESNNAFGSAIHFKDTEEEMARQARIKDEEQRAKRAQERKAILAEMEAEDKAEQDRIAQEKADNDAAEKQRLEDEKRKEADSRLKPNATWKKDELLKFAEENEIQVDPSKTKEQILAAIDEGMVD